MNIHDKIYFGIDGRWHVRFEHVTIDKRERNFGTGTTQFWQAYQSGWEAVEGLMKYCNDNGIEFSGFDIDTWKRYYADCDSHLDYMMKKKSTMQPGDWDIAFSCDAPNKPGYARANND